MNVDLSEKDRKFREFALEGSMWKVIWKVCYPLAIYQSLNQLFKILDTMMAAHISANAVSTVAYLSQINMAISALGGGLAVGASIKISEAYGEGNFELVKRRVSTLFALCGLLGMAILAILIPGCSAIFTTGEYAGRIYRGGDCLFYSGTSQSCHHLF